MSKLQRSDGTLNGMLITLLGLALIVVGLVGGWNARYYVMRQQIPFPFTPVPDHTLQMYAPLYSVAPRPTDPRVARLPRDVADNVDRSHGGWMPWQVDERNQYHLLRTDSPLNNR